MKLQPWPGYRLLNTQRNTNSPEIQEKRPLSSKTLGESRLFFFLFFLLPPCPQTTPVVQKHNTVHGERTNQTQRNQNRPAGGLGKDPCGPGRAGHIPRGESTERRSSEGARDGLSPRLLPSCVCREQSRGSTTKPLRPERTPKSLPAARATGLAVRT